MGGKPFLRHQAQCDTDVLVWFERIPIKYGYYQAIIKYQDAENLLFKFDK